MLTWLGLAAITALLALILFRVTSVLVALTLPIAAASPAASRPNWERSMDGIRGVARPPLCWRSPSSISG
jgi:hypothetical protein